jgi:Zn-dependent protease with chaperone function
VNRFEGRFFDGQSSRAIGVDVWLTGGSVRIRGEGVDRELPLGEVEASPRIGRTPRLLRLPDGASVELADSDALAACLAQGGRERARLVVALERRVWTALLALVAAAGVLYGLVQFGVPALARAVAFALPENVEAGLSDKALAALDLQWFEPTQLDDATRARIEARFRQLLAASPEERPVQLHHRRGGTLGANAFALPGTAIVVTDELVALAEADDEIAAVLAHELGHIAHRHALRSLLQNVGVGVLVAGALGDFTSVSAASGSLPVLLTELHYSRSFEREADADGADRLDRAGIPREHLARMLERLAASHGGDGPWTSYLSTHPATEERVRALREP